MKKEIIVYFTEPVRYNGYIGSGYGYSKGIKKYMKKYLKYGEFYEAIYTCFNYDCVEGNDYYCLRRIPQWFSCKSFDINYRNKLIEKYNLR